MKRTTKDKTTLADVNMIEWIRSYERIYFAAWQRDLTWKVDNISSIVAEILDLAEQTDLTDQWVDLLNMIVFRNDEACFVADGQSRTMALNIFIRAFNHYLEDNHVTDVTPIKNIEITYLRDSDNDKYVKFLRTNKGNPYASLYKYAYDEIAHWIDDGNGDPAAIANVINNHITVTVTEYRNEELAMKVFVLINTAGVPLTKDEIVASLLEFYQKEYNITIPYDEADLEEAFVGYYYLKRPNDQITFNPAVISSFMENEVGKSIGTFRDFRRYMLRVAKFKESPWYDILSLLDRGKSMKVAFAMAGSTAQTSNKTDLYDMDSEEVNRLLSAMFTYAIIAATKKTNAGGTTSGFYVDMLSWVGKNESPLTIAKRMETWVEKSISGSTISMNELSKGLDRLNNNIHKAILLFVYNQCNRSSRIRYEQVHLEHSYSEKPSIAWEKNGWPTDPAIKNQWISCLGNKFLLAKKYNEELGREFLDSKAPIYEEFFAKEAALRNTPNYFDGYLYKEKKHEYAIQRRDAYASFLADSAIGKIMVK